MLAKKNLFSSSSKHSKLSKKINHFTINPNTKTTKTPSISPTSKTS